MIFNVNCNQLQYIPWFSVFLRFCYRNDKYLVRCPPQADIVSSDERLEPEFATSSKNENIEGWATLGFYIVEHLNSGPFNNTFSG